MSERRFEWNARRYPTNWSLGSIYWWYDKKALRSAGIGSLGMRCKRFTLSFCFLCFGLNFDWTWR